MEFRFQIATLKLVARFCSSDETRYALTGVYVEAEPGKPVLLVATDARRLIEFRTDWKHDHIGPGKSSFIIPEQFLQTLNIGLETHECVLHIDGDGTIVIDHGLQVWQYRCHPIKAVFPDWKRVIDPLPARFPARRFLAHPVVLRDFIEVCSKLEPRTDHVEFLGEDHDSAPLVLKTNRLVAALMPMAKK